MIQFTPKEINYLKHFTIPEKEPKLTGNILSDPQVYVAFRKESELIRHGKRKNGLLYLVEKLKEAERNGDL